MDKYIHHIFLAEDEKVKLLLMEATQIWASLATYATATEQAAVAAMMASDGASVAILPDVKRHLWKKIEIRLNNKYIKEVSSC